MKFHPDRNRDDKNAEEKFKLIVEAYNILSSEESRKKYDIQLKNQIKKQTDTIRPNKTTVRPRRAQPGDFKKQFDNYFGSNPTSKKTKKKKKTKSTGDINTDDLFNNFFAGNEK